MKIACSCSMAERQYSGCFCQAIYCQRHCACRRARRLCTLLCECSSECGNRLQLNQMRSTMDRAIYYAPYLGYPSEPTVSTQPSRMYGYAMGVQGPGVFLPFPTQYSNMKSIAMLRASPAYSLTSQLSQETSSTGSISANTNPQRSPTDSPKRKHPRLSDPSSEGQNTTEAGCKCQVGNSETTCCDTDACTCRAQNKKCVYHICQCLMYNCENL